MYLPSMERETADELLRELASGASVDRTLWPSLRDYIVERMNHIARHDFPTTKLPTPSPAQTLQTLPSNIPSAMPSSPTLGGPNQDSALDANKENTMPPPPAPASQVATASTATASLAPQIQAQLDENVRILRSFAVWGPFTIQRLAELILEPRRHYRFVAPWLHAIDRTIHVTSSTDRYPLPAAVPDMSTMTLANGVAASSSSDPAEAVSWGNPTTTAASALGSDEALGGALLTPIPWLAKRTSPVEQSPSHAEIRTEHTETIDGPNGMGSIETVSVSVNGISSLGSGGAVGQRAVTQGEILREEQQAGVVPVSQLDRETEEEDDEVPHARGPEEIGAEDLGPQRGTTALLGSAMDFGIDLEAAVGRKASHDNEASDGADAVSDAGSKRDAEEELGGAAAAKKLKESDAEAMDRDDPEEARKPQAEVGGE